MILLQLVVWKDTKDIIVKCFKLRRSLEDYRPINIVTEYEIKRSLESKIYKVDWQEIQHFCCGNIQRNRHRAKLKKLQHVDSFTENTDKSRKES